MQQSPKSQGHSDPPSTEVRVIQGRKSLQLLRSWQRRLNMVEGAEERREKTKFSVNIGASCTVGTFACSSMYWVLARMVWAPTQRCQGPSRSAFADLIPDRDTRLNKCSLYLWLCGWACIYHTCLPPPISLSLFLSLPQDFFLFLFLLAFWIGNRRLFDSPAVAAKKDGTKLSQPAGS